MSNFIKYGIDLGTTNSCIARCEGTDIRVYPNNEQMNVTPSAVRLLKSGRLIVGQRAYAALSVDPDNVAIEFKRWMGQKNTANFPVAARTLSAEELSAEVLKSLCENAQRHSGEEIRAAAVTVPAAFGALQCEATARAARLAGLEESPLLQEPIAAAIAYGIAPGAKDQRWLVFDLGGGTLDVAIISTRNGRLAVLEHRGNNLLGGKDIDRRIAEEFLLPALAKDFALPEPGSPEHKRLLRRLIAKAEEAKIELSTAPKVVVSLIDLGEDTAGESLEGEVQLSRAQLERTMQPVVEECLRLTKEAIAGARMAAADLDRILLVGGPTQSPLIRAALTEQVSKNVDFSLDPMTVVARGAALFAASVERTSNAPAPAATGKLSAQLAFDPVSSSLQCPVSGRVDHGDGVHAHEIKIDSEDGFWTSGWVPLADDLFEVNAGLQEDKVSRFWLYARDKNGQLLEIEPGEFSIRQGLVVSAPPLPHTISVEVAGANGKPMLEPVFARSTPLPNQQVKKYRASHTLNPNEPGTVLVIKLWEGEELSDPEANVWVGKMLIASDDIQRAIPEGSEIELSINIDASRHITVEAFVPHLNKHFADHVYVPQRDEQDYSHLARAVSSEVETHNQRLEEIEKRIGDGDGKEGVQELRKEIDSLSREQTPRPRPRARAIQTRTNGSSNTPEESALRSPNSNEARELNTRRLRLPTSWSPTQPALPMLSAGMDQPLKRRNSKS
ncbi:MAG: Hsp70 family protein [Elusimicrobiota bacterium]|nr:MAG: Hsp70 family protein [Elusimicrobiota bacterium]